MTINHTGWRDLTGLAAAVISAALDDLVNHQRCSECNLDERDTVERKMRRVHRLNECAGRWFASEDNTPGSLVWWCAFVDMPPDRVREAARRRIARYREAQLKAVVPT